MDLRQAATDIANKYGIPPELFLRQISQESGWDPNVVSGAGAEGLLQIMPGTQDYLGVTDPFDPLQSLDAGARYLAEQYRAFGDWPVALAAYNAGPGNVRKYGGIPPFDETQGYVTNIMGGTTLPGMRRVQGPAGGPVPPPPTYPPAPSADPTDGMSIIERILSKQGFEQSADAAPIVNIWNAIQGKRGPATTGGKTGLLNILGVL